MSPQHPPAPHPHPWGQPSSQNGSLQSILSHRGGLGCAGEVAGCFFPLHFHIDGHLEPTSVAWRMLVLTALELGHAKESLGSWCKRGGKGIPYSAAEQDGESLLRAWIWPREDPGVEAPAWGMPSPHSPAWPRLCDTHVWMWTCSSSATIPRSATWVQVGFLADFSVFPQCTSGQCFSFFPALAAEFGARRQGSTLLPSILPLHLWTESVA